MDPYEYRLLQRCKDGTLWAQRDEHCQAGDMRQIRQAVIAGYLRRER